MEKLLLRSRSVEEAMDLHSLSLFPQARAPPKFKMPTLDKFDGTGCPRAHLKMYMRALQPLRANGPDVSKYTHRGCFALVPKFG